METGARMRLLQLTVQNVRGLRDLTLQLDAKNVVIWGPNGAGKSCVVDAIDFLFTGKLSRLMGEVRWYPKTRQLAKRESSS